MKLLTKNNRGFTILELIVSMTLFAMVLTSVILAIQGVSLARVKSLNRIALLEDLYLFSEQLFTQIKDGGTIDYEEYWNRTAVGTGMSTTSSGHYATPTGVGNYGYSGQVLANSSVYGSGIYLCRSNNGTRMGTGGCLTNFNNGTAGTGAGVAISFAGSPQRYGQYVAQFTDYNSNASPDLGDENGDGSIVGDDDDRALGDTVGFGTGSMRELYLINKTQKSRTYFRWTIKEDVNRVPGTPSCAVTDVGGQIQTNSGCVGTVQILKLKGADVGLLHTGATPDKTAYDGIIDTWVCKKDWNCLGPNVGLEGNIATGLDGEWVDLFPSSVNVKNFSFQMYPVKDPWLSWGAPDALQGSPEISPFIHPYIRLNLELGFAWGKRRLIKNEDPTISISTTVSLNDFN